MITMIGHDSLYKEDWKDPEGQVKEALSDDCIKGTNGFTYQHKCCMIVEKLKAALDIYEGDSFSRKWLKEMMT